MKLSSPCTALALATATALLLVGGGFASASAAASSDTSAASDQAKPALLARSKNGNAFFAFGPPALTGIAAAALSAPSDTVTGALVGKVDTFLSAKYDPETVAAWRRLVAGHGSVDAVAGPALSGEIKCFVGPAGTVVGLRYGSAQVCETSDNVVDIKIGTGYVSNVKVVLSTPNATVGGLEFVVTNGKKSTSTFCGRALGLSAWIGKPGQAVGAIGGTCAAPTTAARRRRGRSMLEDGAKPEVEAAAANAAPAEAAAAAPSPSSPALSLPPPPLLPPPHHGERRTRQPPPPRKARRSNEDEEAAAAAASSPALAAAAPAAAAAAATVAAPPPSLSRRRLAQAPPSNGTTGGLSAGTMQVVLVPAPQGENDSGAYGNGTIFGA